MTTRKPTRAAAPRKPATPKLAEGETYVGITLHDDRLHHLILLPGETTATWTNADAWAHKQGGMLPSRHDGLVLLKHAKARFERAWYWLGEQHAGAAQFAWVQSFVWGLQTSTHQHLELRARAIRRVAI